MVELELGEWGEIDGETMIGLSFLLPEIIYVEQPMISTWSYPYHSEF